jgi:hypothetical protein
VGTCGSAEPLKPRVKLSFVTQNEPSVFQIESQLRRCAAVLRRRRVGQRENGRLQQDCSGEVNAIRGVEDPETRQDLIGSHKLPARFRDATRLPLLRQSLSLALGLDSLVTFSSKPTGEEIDGTTRPIDDQKPSQRCSVLLPLLPPLGRLQAHWVSGPGLSSRLSTELVSLLYLLHPLHLSRHLEDDMHRPHPNLLRPNPNLYQIHFFRPRV